MRRAFVNILIGKLCCEWNVSVQSDSGGKTGSKFLRVTSESHIMWENLHTEFCKQFFCLVEALGL